MISEGDWNDTYWENEQDAEFDSKGNRNINGWIPMAALPKMPIVTKE